MAITFVARSNLASGTGDITVTIPTGYAEGDLLILQVESANEAIATPSGWTQAPNSPQGFGTAATSGGVRLGVFYKYASSSESSVVVADTGDHTTGLMTCWRGVHSSIPFHVTAGRATGVASTLISCPSITTTIDECMIVNFVAINRDADAESTTPWNNSSLDDTTPTAYYKLVTTGYGGGCAYAYATKNVAGSVSETTTTLPFSTTHNYLTVALNPPSTGEEYSGSGSISQGSSVSATNTINKLIANSISQASSVNATKSISKFGSCSINQGQTVVANGNKSVSKVNAISQASTVNATKLIAKSNSSSVAQVSTVVATKTISKVTTGVITQSSTLQSIYQIIKFKVASVSQSSTVNATGVREGGSESYSGSCAINQSSSLNALGTKLSVASLAVNQPSTVQANIYKIAFGQSSINTTSNVSASGIAEGPTEEHSGSCVLSQSSAVQAIGRKSANAIVTVSQSSTIQSVGLKQTSLSCHVSQSQSVTAQSFKTIYTLASIAQSSKVHTSRNAPMSKKNRFNVAFVPKEVATVQASANQGILVQYEKETEGDITMSSPHREEIKL